MASTNFINECKNYANCNRLGELKVRDDLEISGLEGNTSQEGTPTPDNPINVNTVTGRNEIDIVGKNLLEVKRESYTSNGITTTYNSNTGLLHSSGTTTTSWPWIVDTTLTTPIPSGTTLTFSTRNALDYGVSLRLYYTNNDREEMGISAGSFSNKRTVTHDIIKIAVLLNRSANVEVNEDFYLQLEKGNTKTDFEPYRRQSYEINLGKNLFDKDNATLNKGVSTSTGYLYNDTNSFATDYIEITPNENYVVNGYSSSANRVYGYAYDSSKTPLVAISTTANKNTFKVTNTSAKYIRLTGIKSEIDTYQLEKGTKPTTYSPYFTPIELCKIGDYKDTIIHNINTKNLFDDSVANNKWLNGNGVLANETNANTIKIYCDENETFTLSANFGTNTSESAIVIACFDENDNMLSRNAIGSNYSPVVTKTTPANTKYIYAGHYKTKPITIQLEKSSTATSYQPYEDGWYIKKNISKVILNGSETTWALHNSNADRNVYRITKTDKLPYTNNADTPKMFSDYFIPVSNNSTWVVGNLSEGSSSNYIYYVVAPTYTLDTFKTWLSSNNVTTYYVLKTPTYTKITNEALINQLETIKNAKGQFGSTTIIVNSENQPIIVNSTITDGTLLNQDNYIQEYTIDSGCYVDGEIIGTIYSKKLETNLLASTSLDLENKELVARVGVKYSNDTIEKEELGKFTVEKPTDEQIENSTSLVAYDDLINNIDEKYVTELDYENDNITIGDIYEELCRHLELTPVTTTFTNSNMPVTSSPFTNGEKNREVLKSIEKVSCSYVDIDRNENTIDLVWLSDTLDYTFQKDDYSSLEGGKTIYGPINSLVIRNSQIESENVTISDEESIATNGEHQLVIAEDYFLYDEALREAAITGIWNKVHGLTYVDCKLTTYTGKPFLKIGDKIRIYTDTNEYFDTYVLKHQFKYNGAFESVIESPALTEQEVKLKQDISLQDRLRNTQIIVNKQDGTITSLVNTTETLTDTATNALGLANSANTAANNVNTDLQAYKSTVSSQFTQTANDYTLLFTQAITAANDAADTEEEHYQTQQQYIRFAGDTISLGKTDSPFTAELSSTELAFKEDNTKVAYISNKKMNITEAEVKDSLTLGNFGFVPRNNGSLSFRKVK